MAAVLASAVPARQRPARVPSSAKVLTGNISGTTASGGHSPAPGTASNVSLLLTNLRLLDLDLLPDWPGINSHIFSQKDASQGQKKRVQCVEWALYRLFALWDPEETRNVRRQ